MSGYCPAMRFWIFVLLLMATPVQALNEGLQCVPYARALTGVEIRGDAHTWWGQAEGRYQRGAIPKVGAIMSFRPHGGMRLGHVAAVRRIVDSRTVMVSHANWSTINGIRGHIENDVMVVDASDANDWSRVRVWYSPNAALGTTEWPLNGFIYPNKARSWAEGRQAVVALLGYQPDARVANQNARLPTMPQALTRKGNHSFSLKPGLLDEIERNASKERRSIGSKKAISANNSDPIARIMADLPH
jgi:surface antigen